MHSIFPEAPEGLLFSRFTSENDCLLPSLSRAVNSDKSTILCEMPKSNIKKRFAMDSLVLHLNFGCNISISSNINRSGAGGRRDQIRDIF